MPTESPFVPGKTYRRRQLHETYGGQRQGGISTPAKQPFVFLFTGESGHQYGYRDGWSDDGVFLYTGEGQRGNMEFIGGNKAIRDHADAGKALHVFEQVKEKGKKGFVRYHGQMFYAGHRFREATDTDGKPRKAIVFELTPIETNEGTAAVPGSDETEPREDRELRRCTLAELRKKALDNSADARTAVERKAQSRYRSRAIRLYVLRRAGELCEACGEPAPFRTQKTQPYLEPHHIRRLTDGGPDHPRWVIATCPNCHRRAHYSADAADFNRRLADIVGRVES